MTTARIMIIKMQNQYSYNYNKMQNKYSYNNTKNAKQVLVK